MSEEVQSNLIPQGTYTAKAVDWKFGYTEKGDPQVGVSFEITQEGSQKGRHITKYLFFTEKTVDRSIDSLRYMGLDGDDLSVLANRGGGLDKNEVSIVVEHDTYNDKTRAQVSWINRVASVVMNREMAPEDITSFAEQMKQKLRSADIRRQAREKSSSAPMRRPDPTPSRGPEQPPRASGMNDDDIPF